MVRGLGSDEFVVFDDVVDVETLAIGCEELDNVLGEATVCARMPSLSADVRLDAVGRVGLIACIYMV